MDIFSIKTIYIFIILIDSVVPLIIWPRGQDYFYLPKIVSIFFLLLLSIFILIFSIWKRKIELKFSLTLLPIFLYIAWAFLSAVLSKYRAQAFWGGYLRWEGAVAMGAYLLILYLSFLCGRYKMDLNIIVKFIFASAALISAYALLQYFGIDIIPRDYIRKRWVFVSFSTLGNPDFLGSYLCIVYPISLCYYLNCKKNKTIYLVLNILLFSAVVCTRARSTWVGTFISFLFIILVTAGKDSKKIRRTVFIGLIYAVIAVILNAVHNSLILSKLHMFITDFQIVVEKNNMLHAGSQRLFIWRRALDYIFRSPIVGSGPDTFGRVFKMSAAESMQYFNSYNVYVDKAHNEFLQIVITMGFPALIFYTVFLLLTAKQAFKKILNAKNNVLLISFFCSVLSYVVQSFFNISVVSTAPLYWSMLGFLLSLSNT